MIKTKHYPLILLIKIKTNFDTLYKQLYDFSAEEHGCFIINTISNTGTFRCLELIFQKKDYAFFEHDDLSLEFFVYNEQPRDFICINLGYNQKIEEVKSFGEYLKEKGFKKIILLSTAISIYEDNNLITSDVSQIKKWETT